MHGDIEQRARFEAWAFSQAMPIDSHPVMPDQYFSQLTEAAWDGWQAALASQAQPVEMSPEFTDTARAAIAWVLWHHQGGSSAVGQPLRFALGMGDHDQLSESQIAEAKRYAAWAGATTADFHRHRSPEDSIHG